MKWMRIRNPAPRLMMRPSIFSPPHTWWGAQRTHSTWWPPPLVMRTRRCCRIRCSKRPALQPCRRRVSCGLRMRKAEATLTSSGRQRWASTLANRSNIRAKMYVFKVWESVARRGRKRFIASWGQDVTYLSLHPMPPLPQGHRSKVKSRPFAHLCRQELNKRLQHVPNSMTRWSSVFDAVQELNRYLDKPDSRLVLKTSKSQRECCGSSGPDPDPRVSTTDSRIWIRFRIQIMLFFRQWLSGCQQKIIFFLIFLLLFENPYIFIRRQK